MAVVDGSAMTEGEMAECHSRLGVAGPVSTPPPTSGQSSAITSSYTSSAVRCPMITFSTSFVSYPFSDKNAR